MLVGGIGNYNRMGDIIAWHYEKNGMFFVKSAYNLALSHKEEQGQSSKECKWGMKALGYHLGGQCSTKDQNFCLPCRN